jgi:diguanylate cyclase (GGDEF)-like protein
MSDPPLARFESVDPSLEAERRRSLQHARRIDALWQIANNPSLNGDAVIHAMLRQASRAIRPSQRFVGFLGRIEGDELVTIGAAGHRNDEASAAIQTGLGRRVPIEQTIFPPLGRTECWDDLLVSFRDSPKIGIALKWRAVISTQFPAAGHRYALTFVSPEPTGAAPFGPDDVAYVNVIASSFAKQLHVDQLEGSLRAEEERSRQHAERLEALLRLMNDTSLPDSAMWLAMLAQAVVTIRPEQGFLGTLWRIQGERMILEGIADAPGHGLGSSFSMKIGDAVPLSTTVAGKIVSSGTGTGTRSWDDLQASDFLGDLAHKFGLHAFILTTFIAGGATWVLSFSSNQVAKRPLGVPDHAYIEVLASFFANHVQQRWQSERIRYQQTHDVLTGLLNRSQFRSQTRAAARTSVRHAVVLIDVNSFRDLNQTYGNMIGDAMLVEVAGALQLAASADEIVGRIGGDVFGIFTSNADSKDAVEARALEFRKVFAKPFSTGDREGKEFIALTASLGIAVAPDDGASIDVIHARADSALAAAKQYGPGSMVFYAPGMEDVAQERAILRNEIIDGLAGAQFTLYFQPHLEIGTDRVTGCEALIRWNHPVRGVVLPGKFIPFAEQTGIIANIDTWVMRNAFAAATALCARRPGFRLYFNLSGRQAGDPNLVRAFTAAARSGVQLGNIGVEITESDAMRDIEATRLVCRALRRLNVHVAIDDFGTGYSSLSSLKRLPVDILKIDRSFISGLLNDAHDEAITETILSIAEHFGFAALAEGVEQPEEIAWLLRHACRYVQGFAVAHPLPLAEFTAWLDERDGMTTSA